jgi:hypothetical protein
MSKFLRSNFKKFQKKSNLNFKECQLDQSNLKYEASWSWNEISSKF